MTTQEINRYILVASEWERKYSKAKGELLKVKLENQSLKQSTITQGEHNFYKQEVEFQREYNDALKKRDTELSEHISTLKKKCERYGTWAFVLSAYMIVNVLMKLGVL